MGTRGVTYSVALVAAVAFPFAAEAQPLSNLGSPQAGQYNNGWGRVVDPKGDCNVALNGGTLSISVPGTLHDLNPTPGYNNLDAPRVLQPVDGDFSIQVVTPRFAVPKPNTAANKERPHSIVFSGLLIWQDDQNYLRIARAAYGDGTPAVTVQMEQFSGGKKVAWNSTKVVDEDILLSVTRESGAFVIVVRQGTGKSYLAHAGVRADGSNPTLQNEVKVGVFVINATNAPITHTFRDLQVKKLGGGR